MKKYVKNMKEYVKNMKKYVENMKENMKKYVYILDLALPYRPWDLEKFQAHPPPPPMRLRKITPSK